MIDVAPLKDRLSGWDPIVRQAVPSSTIELEEIASRIDSGLLKHAAKSRFISWLKTSIA